MQWLLAGFLGAAVLSAQVPYSESAFRADPAGWKTWAARAEIQPEAGVSTDVSRGEPGSLMLRGGGNPASSGGWERSVDHIEPGKWYELTAWYRTQGAVHEENEVICRLGWSDGNGKRVGWPDYAWKTTVEGGWRKLTVQVPAPEKATAAKIQLWLHNAPEATVWWDEISLRQIPPPPPRLVRVASIHFRPRGSSGREENVRLFSDVALKAADSDIVLFPEGMTVVGTGKAYADVAEPVPGPTTEALGELARKRNAYVAAGLYERDGKAIYNTAILLDRKGQLVGKYRKVYLPREEVEAGLTPGREYPVFDTDFGKLGLMICWDVHYTDPARALALQGAEIVLLPIWGGNQTLMRARAIENHVFLVSSGYDVPTMVIDPKGETLASTETNAAVAYAAIDLNRRYTWEWLGEMRGRYMRELRLDVPVRRPPLQTDKATRR